MDTLLISIWNWSDCIQVVWFFGVLAKECDGARVKIEILVISLKTKMLTNATQDTFVEYDDHRNEHETHFTVPATIGPEDGRHLFSYLGVFLTYITPRDLHVGNSLAQVLFCDFIWKIVFFSFPNAGYVSSYSSPLHLSQLHPWTVKKCVWNENITRQIDLGGKHRRHRAV